NGNGLETTTDPSATCWCLAGAVQHAFAHKTGGSLWDDVESIRVLSRMIAPNGNPSQSACLQTLVDYNDAEQTSHSDVLSLLDSAITSLRGSSIWNMKSNLQSAGLKLA